MPKTPAPDAAPTATLPSPAPRAASPPATIRVRHPGSHASGAPLAIGPYATGGVIHAVDAATAARLLARGFERVVDAPLAADPTPSALISEE